ncbi:MAG: radical SAM protein [Vampirovibrionia bacterium]
MIYYKYPIYRPPNEADSLLIQATEGCSYKCTFCIGNEGKPFKIRKVSDIKKDLDAAFNSFGNTIKRIFLLDGNAFIMNHNDIIDITEYAYNIFPRLNRVSAYAHAKDILLKTDEELLKIRKSGFNRVYLGIETGDDDLLLSINKQVKAEEIIKAIHKIYNADITLSATIILGLTGSDKEKSYKHAVKTAELINSIKPIKPVPWYISALTLMIPEGTQIKKELANNKFKTMSNIDCLKELLVLLEHLDDDLNKCIFRANHASNYLNLESNNLAKTKNKLIEELNNAINNPNTLKYEFLRGL